MYYDLSQLQKYQPECRHINYWLWRHLWIYYERWLLGERLDYSVSRISDYIISLELVLTLYQENKLATSITNIPTLN